MEWRPVPGFPAYEVSEDGAVRRSRRCRNRPAGFVLRPWTDLYGYLQVRLGDDSGSFRAIPVHQVVALAFVGPRPTKRHEVAHGDGICTNNHWSNLRWATTKQNGDDRAKHGRLKGEGNGRSRLTAAAVFEMRSRFYSCDLTFEQFGRLYGVGETAAREAILGISWRHL